MQILTRLAAEVKNGAPLKVGVVGKSRKVQFCKVITPIISAVFL